jgi:serine/threonine protein kinase
MSGLGTIPFSHSRYEAREVLGRGGQGVVLRVVDREAPSDALVAKVWSGGGAASGADDVTLAGEFALLARLRIPGLVQARDFGRDAASGATMFVEDFVDGPDATAWIAAAEDARVKRARLAEIIASVATTLAALHDAGFLHGDL